MRLTVLSASSIVLADERRRFGARLPWKAVVYMTVASSPWTESDLISGTVSRRMLGELGRVIPVSLINCPNASEQAETDDRPAFLAPATICDCSRSEKWLHAVA